LITGGSHPINVGKGTGRMINPTLRADYLPSSDDPKVKLALAFYREALGVNSIPYQFLGFFKIINILFQTGSEQEGWIRRTLPKLTDHLALPRIEVLRRQHTDIPKYLYGSGRCAVAHAFAEPLVNPENPRDSERLVLDLPLVKALAAYLIEHEFGIKSIQTV
jgi:hypothetical protein